MLKRALALSLVLIISRTVIAKSRCKKDEKCNNPVTAVVKGTGKVIKKTGEAVGTVVKTTGEVVTAPFRDDKKCKTKKYKDTAECESSCESTKNKRYKKELIMDDMDEERTCCDTKTHEVEAC